MSRPWIRMREVRLPGRIQRYWGWVVTVCAALIFIVVHGFFYSFGLLMVELMEEFDSDVTTTGYLGTVAYGCTWIFCIFSTPVVNRIGFRPALILGVVICSLSTLISSFMPGVLPLFGSYSILFGVGNSFICSGAFLSVLAYFPVKHTTLAFGISTAGVNTGMLVFNPIMYAMISRWGWRNALRISCATFLSIALPCTMVFVQPPPSHDVADDDDEKRSRLFNETEISAKEKMLQDEPLSQPRMEENGCIGEDSNALVGMATDDKASGCSDVKYSAGESGGDEKLVAISSEDGIKEVTEDNKKLSKCGGWLQLLGYPDVWLLGIGVLCGNVCVSFLYFSTVNFIVLAGFSKWMASLMMATMGLTEIFGKILIGIVVDRLPIPKLFYMMAANCVGAGVLYASFFAKTEAVMFAIVAVEGCFIMAPLDSLSHSVAYQLYEASFSSFLWSYAMCACGIGGILAAMFGESVDKTGSYDTAIYIIIGVFFTASLFLVLVPVYQRTFSKDRLIVFKNARQHQRKKPDEIKYQAQDTL
ncbi:monocarboxylate transporter 14-like [Lytechinus variegatus]|uniref:monocarboxylate transporter 14-like n=1 Tax=Lytechinus variegatus TaxID=7654 RepID=UPI001BB28AD2|nr:monocarboxylate transporter 14-like [Lytechinus variegatus]